MPKPLTLPSSDHVAPRPSAQDDRAERTVDLLNRLHDADTAEERERLVNEVVVLNMAVANAIAARYASRGVPLDDLRQVAYMALVRATRKYDPTLGNHFLSYCVPTVRGEIRRYFRDQGWMVRPPRRIQELQRRISTSQSELATLLGRSPRPRDVAQHLGEPLEDVVEALSADGCFVPASLDRPVGEEGSSPLGELLPADADSDDRGPAEARVVLGPLVRRLAERDRRILMLRFFRGLTQQEIADDLGVTQMQVSRLLTRILKNLRDDLTDDAHPEDVAVA